MNLFKKIAALILSAAVAASVLCVFAEAGEKKDPVSVIVEVDESADPKLIADVLGDKGYLKAGFVYRQAFNGFSAKADAYAIGIISAFPGVKSLRRTDIYKRGDFSADILGNVTSDDTNNGSDGSGVTVAVLGDGFNTSDPVFSGEGKILYAYDFAENDPDVVPSAANSSGTALAALVSGCSANYAGKAPGASLMLMKIYPDMSEYTDESVICAALEDAYIQGADIVCLDAFISAVNAPGSTLERFTRALAENGIAVVCSAGTNGSAGAFANEDGAIPASYQDYGTIRAPASFSSVISVASAYDGGKYFEYFQASGQNVVYTDITADRSAAVENLFSSIFNNRSLKYADASDIYSLKTSGEPLKGMLALIRSESENIEKILDSAHKAGARGVILFGAESYICPENAPLPAIRISEDDGEMLIGLKEKIITVNSGFFTRVKSGSPIITDTSSRGPSYKSAAKPEIASYGVGLPVPAENGLCASASGATLCAATLCGHYAALLSKARAKYPDTLPTDICGVLLASARPVENENGVPLSPRVQGAGIVSAEAAAGCGVIISVKREITEISRTSPSLNLSVTVVNLTGKERAFSMSASAQCDKYEKRSDNKYYTNGEPAALTGAKINVGGNQTNINRFSKDFSTIDFAVESYASLKLNIKVTISETEAFARSFTFKNGYFIDGYVNLNRLDTNDRIVSASFCAFAGSSYSSSVFDCSVYDEADPAVSASHLDSTASSFGLTQTLGRNIFSENSAFKKEYIVFSPGNDGDLDSLMLNLYVLRDVFDLKAVITDEYGDEVYYPDLPYGLFKNTGLYDCYRKIWDGSLYDNTDYICPDGKYMLKISAKTADQNSFAELSIPIQIDTVKPIFEKARLDVTDGEYFLIIEARDDFMLQAVAVYESGTDFYDGNFILACAPEGVSSHSSVLN
ncbi:MAG: S8 family serine peptidase [Firmicutes bacterium]|nr:S8 family serine peptidase [Bacillota bacterium]